MHKKSLKKRVLAWILAVAVCTTMCDGMSLAGFVVEAADTLEAPAATISGTYTQGQRIVISQRDSATIFYCLSNIESPTTQYSQYVEPIVIDEPGTYVLKTYAFDGTSGLRSEEREFNYVITEMEKAATPTPDLEEGTYNQGQVMFLNCTTPNASIYYTLDGTIPTQQTGIPYNGRIQFDQPGTYYVRAISVASGYRESDVSDVRTYTILETCAKPTSKANAEPDSLGIYRSIINVQLFSETEDAQIYYTMDGSEPTTDSILYNGVPITLGTTTVIKAIAVKEGMRTSLPSTFVYNIQVPLIIRNMKARKVNGPFVSSLTVNYGTTLTQLRAILGGLDIVPTMATDVTGPSILNSQDKWTVELEEGVNRIMENTTATATFTSSDCIAPDGTSIYTVNDGKVVIDITCGNIPVSGIQSGNTYIRIPCNATEVYTKNLLSQIEVTPVIDSSLGVNVRDCVIKNDPSCWTISGEKAYGTFEAPTGYVFDEGAQNTLVIDLETFIPITDVYINESTTMYFDCDATDAQIMKALTELQIIANVPKGYQSPVLTNNATCWTNSGSTADGGTVYTGSFSAPDGYDFTGYSTLTIFVYHDDVPITALTPSVKSLDILFNASTADVLEKLSNININASVKSGMTRPIIVNTVYCWTISEDGKTATGSFDIPEGYQCDPGINEVTVSLVRYTPVTAITTSKTEMSVWYDTPSDEIKNVLSQLIIRAAVPSGAQIPDIENTVENWTVSEDVAVGKFDIPEGYRLQGAEARIEVKLIRQIPVTNLTPSTDTIYVDYYASIPKIQQQLMEEVEILAEVPEGQKAPTLLNDMANRWVLTNMKKTATASFSLDEDAIYAFKDCSGKVVVNVVRIIPVYTLTPDSDTVHVPYNATNDMVYEALGKLKITGSVPTGEIPLSVENNDVWELDNTEGIARKTFTAPDGYVFNDGIEEVSIKIVRDIPVLSLTPSQEEILVSQYATSTEIKKQLANLSITAEVPQGQSAPEIGNRTGIWEISQDGTYATGRFDVASPYVIGNDVNTVTIRFKKYYPIVSVHASKEILSVGFEASEDEILEKLLTLDIYGETERALVVDLENTESCWSIHTGLKQAYGTFTAPEGYRFTNGDVMGVTVNFEYVVPVLSIRPSQDSITVSANAKEADIKTQLATMNMNAVVPDGEIPPVIKNSESNWVVSGSAAYGTFTAPEYYRLEDGCNPVKVDIRTYIPVESLVSSSTTVEVSYNASSAEIFEALKNLQITGIVPEGYEAPQIENKAENWEIYSNYAKGTFLLPEGYRYSEVTGILRINVKRGDIPVESITTDKTTIKAAYGTSKQEIQKMLSKLSLTVVVPNGFEEPYVSNDLSAWTINENIATADFVLPSGYTYTGNTQKPMVRIEEYVPVYGLSASQDSIPVEYDADELEILALLTTLGIEADIPEGADKPLIANSMDCWVLSGNTAVGTFRLPDGYEYMTSDLTVTINIDYSEQPPASYQVNYYGGEDATGTSSTDGSVTEGSIITLPANPFVRKGYTFIGWMDGNITYPSGSLYKMPSHSVSFIARWERIPSNDNNNDNKEDEKKYKVGTTLKGTIGKYKVLKGTQVSFLKNITTKKNYIVPNQIYLKGIKYKVTRIEKDAFKNTKAKKIVLPANIRTVSSRAFRGAKNVKAIVFKGKTVPSFSKTAFQGVKSGTTIYVPKKYLKKYKKAIKKTSLPSGVKIASY